MLFVAFWRAAWRLEPLDLLIGSAQRAIPRTNQSDQLAGAPGCFVELKFVF